MRKMRGSYSDERGRDALAFDPLARRSWIAALPQNSGILVKLQPHRHITPLLMAMDGVRPITWSRPFRRGIEHVAYAVPWRHIDALRALIPAIDAALIQDAERAAAKNAAAHAEADRQAREHMAAALTEAASGERAEDAYWQAMSAALVPMPAPAPSAYGELTPWERRFLSPFCSRFQARGTIPRLSEAQQRIADEIYSKIKHYVVL